MSRESDLLFGLLARKFVAPSQHAVVKALVEEQLKLNGDEYDGSSSHTNISIPVAMAPMPVDSFPADESPFGIRGGAWSNIPTNARAAVRHAIPPANLYWHCGVRLAATPGTWIPR